MPTLKLYINTNNNSLVAGQASTQQVDAGSLPLFYGDTLPLNIYLLQQPSGFNAQDPANSSLAVISTAGLQLFFYLDDGTIGGTIYTQQIAFTTDPTNSFFIGTLALNTAALTTLFGSITTASAWIKIGYVQNGVQTTVLSKQVTLSVGLPAAGVPAVPAGQTALSAEVATATYFPLQPVNGQAIYLASAAGKVIALLYVDNADGSATLQSSPVN